MTAINNSLNELKTELATTTAKVTALEQRLAQLESGKPSASSGPDDLWRLGSTAFEAAPFLDLGKVFTNTDELIGSQVEVTPGLALRGLAPPSVVGRVEIGVSREGPAIFVGLDYPF